MTIDKAADKMKCLKHKALQGAIIVHDTYSDDYELLNESALTALDMAIASLEALKEIRQEAVDAIEDGLYVRNTRILDIIEKHIKDGDKQ